MHILGVDPGETTGWSLVRAEGGRLELVRCGQQDWMSAAHTIMRAARHGRLSAVAAERFLVSAKTAQRGQAYTEAAIGMVGVCRFACSLNEVPLVLESASAAKKTITDGALRALGLWTPGKRHANDAARQAALLCVKRRLVRPEALL
jgi:Holliday junction resolvasome RuvABC endonuclease subunit